MINTLYSISGQKFQVVGSRGGNIHPSATQKVFKEPMGIRSFITGQLKTSSSSWRQFLQRQNSLHITVEKLSDRQIIDKVVELVQRQYIRFYELPQVSHNVMAHNGNGTGYNFIKGPGMLPTIDTLPIEVKDEAHALQIVGSLKTDEDFWPNYLQQNKLEPEKTDAAKGVATETHVAQLMSKGEIVVYSRPYAPPPPVPQKSDMPEPVVEKAVPLGPEVIEVESIYINFQVDVAESGYRNDKLTLVHSGGDYESSLTLGSLQTFDYDWVRLEFTDPPENGTYTLLFDDQEEDSDVYTLFEDVPFSSLADLTPDLEAGA